MKKKIIQFLSAIAPDLLVDFAYKQLTNPQVKKLREHELEVLDQAEKKTVRFHNFDIQTYTWPGGPRTILLVHGWEGQAGNFSDLVERLIPEGYTLFAFDAPSHGFSSKGKTSLFEFNDLVSLFLVECKPFGIISHSFGSVAATYALGQNPEWMVEKYVLLTTPDKFSQRINDVALQIGISETVKNKLIARLEGEMGFDHSTLNVSDFVKGANVRKALILHDTHDKVVPVERARNVHRNWPNSIMEEVQETGHFKILRTEAVLDRVVQFLRE